ncbi:MAG: hypothetical protein ABR505_00970 [Actinomycetota bacterium]
MNKRWTVLAVVLVLLLALAPMDAMGQKKKKKKKKPPPPVEQVVEGSIMFPANGAAAGDPNACFSGIHRRATLLFGDGAQGYFGYHFDVDEATWGGNFVLEVTSGEPDFDIVFYPDFGDQQAVGETVTYETREPGGEEGAIPPNMTKVIVCMYDGLDAAFKYTGTGPGGGTPAPDGSPTGSPTPSPTAT